MPPATACSQIPKLGCLAKMLVTFRKKVRVWMQLFSSRDGNRVPFEALQTVTKHWSVSLAQNIFSDLDLEVRAHSKYVSVERSVVEFAKGKSIRDYRLTQGMTVGQYVGPI